MNDLELTLKYVVTRKIQVQSKNADRAIDDDYDTLVWLLEDELGSEGMSVELDDVKEEVLV
ncbi:MAG: hypothetical protein ACRC9P_10335 [Bacteroides sp.]